MIGNFMADSVKGSKFQMYPEGIQIGIKLHREIDRFTDTHDIVRRSKMRLNGKYGHYAGVIVDIYYDHFLAKNWSNSSSIPLDVYVDSVYELLKKNIEYLPTRTSNMLPYMIEFNWLFNYQFIEGIQRVLEGINQRTNNKSKMNYAIVDLKKHYQDFEQDFIEFFIELTKFSSEKLEELTSS